MMRWIILLCTFFWLGHATADYDIFGNLNKNLFNFVENKNNCSIYFVDNQNKLFLYTTNSKNIDSIFISGAPKKIASIGISYKNDSGYTVYFNVPQKLVSKPYPNSQDADGRVADDIIDDKNFLILRYSVPGNYVYLQKIFDDQNHPVIIIKRDFISGSMGVDDQYSKYLPNGDLKIGYSLAGDAGHLGAPYHFETIPIDHAFFEKKVTAKDRCYDFDIKQTLAPIACPADL